MLGRLLPPSSVFVSCWAPWETVKRRRLLSPPRVCPPSPTIRWVRHIRAGAWVSLPRQSLPSQCPSQCSDSCPRSLKGHSGDEEFDWELANFPGKGQIANILGFAGPVLPLQCQEPVGNMECNEPGCVLIKSYLWKVTFEFHIIFLCHKIFSCFFGDH